MVTATPSPVSRRYLLHLVGGLGVAAAVGGCSRPDADPPARATNTNAPPTVEPSEPAVDTVSTVEVAPAPLVSASAAMLCRDAWGAQPALPGGRPHTISRLTLHHTAVVLGDNSNAPARLRQHQRFHQVQRGWIDIAYHVSVDRNGNIYELRDWNLVGDTATEYDPTGHFLVLCEGDFDQEQVSEAQLNGAATVFAWAAQQFNVSSDTLGGHRDFAATSCPGENLYAHLSSGDLKARIDALLTAGRVDLQKFCGPAASERVAAISAGA